MHSGHMAIRACRRYAVLLGVVLGMFLVAGCQGRPEAPKPDKLGAIKALPAETPPPSLQKEEKLPTIHLKRGKDGSYTWDISGKDVHTVLRADRSLRRGIGACRPVKDSGASEE